MDPDAFSLCRGETAFVSSKLSRQESEIALAVNSTEYRRVLATMIGVIEQENCGRDVLRAKSARGKGYDSANPAAVDDAFSQVGLFRAARVKDAICNEYGGNPRLTQAGVLQSCPFRHFDSITLRPRVMGQSNRHAKPRQNDFRLRFRPPLLRRVCSVDKARTI